MGHEWQQRDEAIVAAGIDDVWAAIATGPGIGSWFMGRTQVEPGPDGTVTIDVGGFAMTSSVTTWDPPHRFGYRSDGPGDQFIAFEFLIEAREGSGTALRLISSGFLPGDDWQDEFEAMTVGGQMYFGTLVGYLDHFAGRFARPVTVTGPPVADWPPVWARLRAALGVGEAPDVGDAVRATVPGVGQLDGVVDVVNSQILGIRTGDGLYRFIQGYFGSFVLGHHLFTDTDDPRAAQAWKTWLYGL